MPYGSRDFKSLPARNNRLTGVKRPAGTVHHMARVSTDTHAVTDRRRRDGGAGRASTRRMGGLARGMDGGGLTLHPGR